MYRKFLSLGNSKELGYAFDSQAFDMKAPMHDHFRAFHTYGDGAVQHSPDWAVTFEQLSDYLASLAEVMQTDEELLDSAKYALGRRPSTKAIEFAASVIWKAAKDTDKVWRPKYFSVTEMKISSSSEKRHDKRYQEITDVHDGTPGAIFRVLIPEHSDGIEKYSYASAIRDWVLEGDNRGYMQLPGLFLKWSKDQQDAQKLRDAYEACWNLVQAYQYRHMAIGHLENYKRHLPPPDVAKSDAA